MDEINQKLAALLVEHPGARILPMISSNCWNEDYHWTIGIIKKIEIDEVYEIDERVYLASKDEEELELDLSEQAINLLAAEGIYHQDEKTVHSDLFNIKK